MGRHKGYDKRSCEIPNLPGRLDTADLGGRRRANVVQTKQEDTKPNHDLGNKTGMFRRPPVPRAPAKAAPKEAFDPIDDRSCAAVKS